MDLKNSGGGGLNPFALAAYKAKPALVKSLSDGKISLALLSGEEAKVRERDIELIHPGPLKSLDGIEGAKEAAQAAAREVWELLLPEASNAISLKELSELVLSDYSPQNAWAAYCLLTEGFYFFGSPGEIYCRGEEEVAGAEKKREEKQKEAGARELFIKSLKKRERQDPAVSENARFMQDIEALALGRSQKSRSMKEAGFGESPEEAHALLLDTGFWTVLDNPHPSRLGLSLSFAKQPPGAMRQEERRDLSGLAALAIDNPWSRDPDDAVSIENGAGGQTVLYVHVADPAAAMGFDAPAEKEARDRGATLYLAEGTFAMLNEAFVADFALGLKAASPALTFKITLDGNAKITAAEIFPANVKVRRLSYADADSLAAGPVPDGLLTPSSRADIALLQSLEVLAKRNLERRDAGGAVNIDLPEAHISIKDGLPVIEQIPAYNSAAWVKECMLLAGEAACFWAAQAGAPLPYVSQEVADIPEVFPPGLAGSYQLRRCMRPRTLSTKPGRHFGLGLDAYTQVTSPLRRYTDLLAHLQIRAFLTGEPLLDADELALRLGAAEAAAQAAVAAERASRHHWTLVFLSGKADSEWDAVALEKKGARWVFVIPALAFETQVSVRGNIQPNDGLRLVLKSVNIPKGEAFFAAIE